MMSRSLLVTVLVTSSVAAAPPDPYAALRERATKVIGAAHDGRVLSQLAELGDITGARLSGTAGYKKGVAWAIAQLQAAGAKNVHTETFTLTHGWQRGTARARVLGPGGWTLRVESLGWSPSTPKGGVRGPVLLVKSLSALPADVKGKIILLDNSEADEDLKGTKRWIAWRKAVAAFKAGGAHAVLRVGGSWNYVLATGSASTKGELVPLPIAGVAREDGKRLQRLLTGGNAMLELELANTITGPVEVANVVGELPGKTKEWLLVGAHLDTWDFADGAQDNGAGTVQVIQTARLLASVGPLERGVRFVLWGAEEQGLNGSFAYVDRHAAELGSCVLVLNTDNGAGHVSGWKVQGRKDLKVALAPIAEHLLAPLGAAKLDMTQTADTDHFPFVVAGVPAIDLLVDGAGYEAIHHRPGDTVDKVDAHAIATGLATIALTALAVASTTQPIAPRLDRAAIEALLEPEGYLEALRLDGRWK